MLGVDIQGVPELMADFKGYKKEAARAVDLAVSDTANAIVKDAKARLKENLYRRVDNRSSSWESENTWREPYKRTGRLLSSIMRKKQYETDKFEAVVGTDVEYAPYIEFGTGDFVEIPEGAEAVAAIYKGAGIRKVNIHAVSFLNYAAVKNTKTFIEKLTSRLNNITH